MAEKFWIRRGLGTNGLCESGDDDEDFVARSIEKPMDEAEGDIDEVTCYDGFKKLTGIELEPGEAIHVSITRRFKYIDLCGECNKRKASVD